jgi:small subunit ribosomal protein S18
MSSRSSRPLKPKKAKKCQFCSDRSSTVDYKSASQLKRFISDRGKILARRHTGNCARHQRVIAEHIKRARFMALLHYTADQVR